MAQSQLSDIVASAQIFASAGKTVSAVNKNLSNKAEALNSDPYGEGWMAKVDGGTTNERMNSATHEMYCEERSLWSVVC